MGERKYRAAGPIVAGMGAWMIVWLGGCMGKLPDRSPAPPSLSEDEIAQALVVYEDQSCGTCHGDDAEGSEYGPALRDLAPYWNADRIVTYLEDPERFRAAHPEFDARRDVEYDLEMPDFSHVSEEERRLLATWLLER